MPCTLEIMSPIFQNCPMNFKIVKRKEVQTMWEQWPGSNCSNRRSFEQQINEQIRYAVQLYQFRMSFQLYSHNFTSQTENGNVSGNLQEAGITFNDKCRVNFPLVINQTTSSSRTFWVILNNLIFLGFILVMINQIPC